MIACGLDRRNAHAAGSLKALGTHGLCGNSGEGRISRRRCVSETIRGGLFATHAAKGATTQGRGVPKRRLGFRGKFNGLSPGHPPSILRRPRRALVLALRARRLRDQARRCGA